MIENLSETYPELVGDDHARDEVARALYSSEITSESWHAVTMLLVALMFQGYSASLPTISAPWLKIAFHLSDSQMARTFAGFALGSFGALGLARMADRVGRQRVLMWVAILGPAAALGAATAHNIFIFATFTVMLEALMGAALACSVVMIAEMLPVPRRANGQSWAGLATAVGGGLCVFIAPVLQSLGMSWRWLFAVPATGIVVLPIVVHSIPESTLWRSHVAQGFRPSHFYDVFLPIYRWRTIAIILCGLLAAIAAEGVSTYSYFHAVSLVGLSAESASELTIIGGGLGMLGFPIGAWAAERFGRVPTIVSSGASASIVALAYYWGPPAGFSHPALWLGGAFLFMNAAANIILVAGNAAITELFPTALRGTIIGWYAMIVALGSLTAELTISVLAPTSGGISLLTGWLALLGIPGAILFGLIIEETRGLTLEAASRESDFRDR